MLTIMNVLVFITCCVCPIEDDFQACESWIYLAQMNVDYHSLIDLDVLFLILFILDNSCSL